MSPEHERHFTARMAELADLFGTIGKPSPDGCCPDGEGECVILDERAAEDFNVRSQAVYDEFTALGYGAEDWNALWMRSGAAAVGKA